MQIIGTRETSSFRVPSDYFENKPTFTPGIDPTTGGPLVVVDDFTDTPASSPEGKRWIVDVNPDSRTYRKVIEVTE